MMSRSLASGWVARAAPVASSIDTRAMRHSAGPAASRFDTISFSRYTKRMSVGWRVNPRLGNIAIPAKALVRYLDLVAGERGEHKRLGAEESGHIAQRQTQLRQAI